MPRSEMPRASRENLRIESSSQSLNQGPNLSLSFSLLCPKIQDHCQRRSRIRKSKTIRSNPHLPASTSLGLRSSPPAKLHRVFKFPCSSCSTNQTHKQTTLKMPSREEVAYFGAGPASLPTSVLEEASSNLLNFESYGRGISEISHRSATATNVINSAKANLVKLLDIPEDYEVLFMQGGGSGQFSAVVYNLVSVWVERRRRKVEEEIKAGGEGQSDESVKEQVLQRLKKEVKDDLKMDYLVTGSWSLKASQEAASLVGPENVNVAVDARGSDKMFKTIPAEDTWKLTPTKREGGKGSAFVYYCDNETVDGVEFPSFPKVLEPQSDNEEDERIVVADMSSNFLSRKVDVTKFGVIFVSQPSTADTSSSNQTLIESLGRCSEKRRHGRRDNNYHPKIPPPPKHRKTTHRPPPLPKPTSHSRNLRLRHHRKEQLPLQHTAHLPRSHHRISHAQPSHRVRRQEDIRTTRGCG